MKNNEMDRYVGGFDMGYDNGCGCGYEMGCELGEGTVKRTLLKNIGRVVNIYADDFEYTGLVARVDGNTVKLITSIPSAPYEMSRFERMDGNCDCNVCNHCKNSHFGSAIIIPLCKITAVSVVEI